MLFLKAVGLALLVLTLLTVAVLAILVGADGDIPTARTQREGVEQVCRGMGMKFPGTTPTGSPMCGDQ